MSLTDPSDTPGSVTLNEVAQRAGVSGMTVSRVLRGSANVAAETRARVEALERTLSSALASADHLRRHFAQRKPRLIVLVARGTSDNAAQFGRYLIEITTGIPVSLAAPSIHTLYGAKINYKEALVIAISQSGESPVASSTPE